MKHYSIQSSIMLGDARRHRVKVVRPKPRKSRIKMPLDEKQIQWGIGHNLTWIMGLLGDK